MKRTSTDAPYLSICLVVRNSATKKGVFDGRAEGYGIPEKGFDGEPVTAYERTLRSIRDRAPNAELVIVDTCSSDPRTIELSQAYADVWEEYRGPKGDWNAELFAVDDMASARQRSFDLAHGAWLMWIDDDDILADPNMAERMLKANGRWAPAPKENVKDEKLIAAGPQTLEDILRFADAHSPTMEGFVCPYLYQFEKNDVQRAKATTFNPRERIVRNDKKWHWAQPGHEILVANDPNDMTKLIKLSHLLYVHQKIFSAEDIQYSLDRHYAILIKKYEAGEANIQECLYLENFSMSKCPQRRKEFALAALSKSNVPFERMRVLIRLANIASDSGLHLEALDHFTAATGLAPNMPDPWLMGGQYFEKNKQWLKAAEWFDHGIRAESGHPLSDFSPRLQAVDFRCRAASALLYASRQLVAAGFHDNAIEALNKATALVIEAKDRPELAFDTEDKREVYQLAFLIENEFHSLIRVRELHAHWQFLISNDETQKAMKVLDVVPHTALDHPLVIKMEKWKRGLENHLADPAAYASFYENDIVEDQTSMESPDVMLDPATCEHRVKFLIANILAHPEWTTVIEAGPFDGITALPVLKACPQIKLYTAVEAQSTALNRLIERAKAAGLSDRLRPVHALDLHAVEGQPQYHDVVVFHEVIEHVPDPVASIAHLFSCLKPNGRLFISTPNYSYDKGHPANPEKRDKRGHVRAYTPRTLVDDIEAAGGRVVELQSSRNVGNVGDTICCMVEKATPGRSDWPHTTNVRDGVQRKPVAFSVAGALWDWHASHVIATGIGASEESIVYVARELGRDRRNVSVYGPVPVTEGGFYGQRDEEVREGVKYWHLDSRRKIHPDSTVIVSRAPSYGRENEEAVGSKLDKLLWLQDVGYGDLNAETAADYRKIIAVSPWHKEHMQSLGVPEDKIAVIPNFVLREHFDDRNPMGRSVRLPHHFIYASSPDRGLITLLKLWPHILEKWPDATLSIFYGWAGAATLTMSSPGWTSRYQTIRRQYDALRWQKGVCDFGRINHHLLAREYQKAAVWLYPTAFCCHPDTMISVPGDHRNGLPVRVRIADLDGKKNFPVYTLDLKKRRFKIGTAKRVWKTKVARELVALTLDDGSVLRVTPDHRILNFDLEWVEAGDLRPGDRLSALHFRYQVMIKDLNGRWEHESRLVGEWMAGRRLRTNEHVDHLDEMRLDNSHRVVSVERIHGSWPVYDMEVEDTHNFVADGVVVHNCETDCNAARKARAGGAVPVTTPLAGLLYSAKSEWTQYVQQPEGFDPDVTGEKVIAHEGWPKYVENVIAAVADAIVTPEAEREKMSAEALETGSVEAVMPKWKALLGE